MALNRMTHPIVKLTCQTHVEMAEQLSESRPKTVEIRQLPQVEDECA